MEVTELGMVTLVREVQCEKVQSPMDMTELGKVMLVRGQPEKAQSPMDVTELGMVVALHPKIRVLLAVSIMALQPFLLS